MRTGRVPWLGLHVDIVAGPWKGQRTVVLDINCYRYDPKVPHQFSELTLTVERLVMAYSNALVKVDYEDVRFTR